MIIKKTKLEGVFTIDLEPRADNRGYFTRVFAQEEFNKHKIPFSIVHANRSLTVDKGTIRGLHYQIYPKQEDKIIQCLKGSIFDVALDLRKGSKTYGKWVGEVLSAENMRMLLVPKGFAHGFQALQKNCIIEYFVSQAYAPKHERGHRWNDPAFNIKWPIKNAILSDKDSNWPLIKK